MNNEINANTNVSNDNQKENASEVDAKNSRKLKLLGGTVGLAIALGLYTQLVNWNPLVRTLGHFFGAVGVPAYASLTTSFLIGTYEELANKTIRGFNKAKNKVKQVLKIKDKEKTNEKENSKDKEKLDGIERKFKVSPKTKQNILRGAALLGSLGYMGFCASWESWQFAQSGVFQAPQYIADFGGPIVGMLNIGTVDSEPLLAKINEVEDKLKSKFRNLFKKGKEKELEKDKTEEPLATSIDKKVDQKEQVAVWDLRGYNADSKQIQENLENEGRRASNNLEHRQTDEENVSRTQENIEGR